MALTHTRYFRWDHPSAPSLSGTAGSLYSLLKACLVGNVDGVAYGSGANERRAAGWSIAYDNGSNKIAFRNSLAAGGNGCYLRVDDSNAQYAIVQCYESMSDIDTGTAPAASATSYVIKSNAASSAARAWVICADEITLWGTQYLASATPPAAPLDWQQAWGAGGYDPFIAGDQSCFLAASETLTIDQYRDHSRWLGVNDRDGTYDKKLNLSRSAGLVVAPTAVNIPYISDNGQVLQQAIGGSSVGFAGYPMTGYAGHVSITALVRQGRVLRGRLRGVSVPLTYASDKTTVGSVVALPGRPSGASATALCGLVGVSAGSYALAGRLFAETVVAWD